jgi:hypothetical protein
MVFSHLLISRQDGCCCLQVLDGFAVLPKSLQGQTAAAAAAAAHYPEVC